MTLPGGVGDSGGKRGVGVRDSGEEEEEEEEEEEVKIKPFFFLFISMQLHPLLLAHQLS